MNIPQDIKEPWLVTSFIEFISTKAEFSLERTNIKEGKHIKTAFLDPVTQLLFETYIAHLDRVYVQNGNKCSVN